jgi:hypothetical protein
MIDHLHNSYAWDVVCTYVKLVVPGFSGSKLRKKKKKGYEWENKKKPHVC